ncbi:MAG: epoxide hydrolase family protein [Acidimicrobiia bacterium]
MESAPIAVPEPILLDLAARLHATRWPEPLDELDWEVGTPRPALRALCHEWATDYDWSTTEAQINAFDPTVTEIDGQRVHFLHARSENPDAMPLILSHGWPGSVIEFLDVIEPLRATFHVVVPSLPGYGFSGPTRETGWSTVRIARAFAELMARLGYDRYFAQGGDWGSFITQNLARVDPEHCVGIHLNMVVAGPPADGGPPLTESEQEAVAALGHYMTDGAGYMQIQNTRPQSLSYGLTDSPAGLAGWILEKFYAWTDGPRVLDDLAFRRRVLDNLTVYWATNTAGSAARLYWEERQAGLRGDALRGRIETPTGCAVYPCEIIRAPRAWAEAAFNVVQWTEHEHGGHFAALEAPDAFVADLESFTLSLLAR